MSRNKLLGISPMMRSTGFLIDLAPTTPVTRG